MSLTPQRKSLRDIVESLGGTPPGMSDVSQMAAVAAPPMAPMAGPGIQLAAAPNVQPRGMSKSQLYAGILSDALAGFIGKPGAFAAQNAQNRQQQQETAQWHQRREMTRQDARADQQWEWDNKPREARAPSEFESVLEASGVQRGTPQWTQAFQTRAQRMLNPDPYVTTTIPGGMYTGPQSGLADALAGYVDSPADAAAAPTPVGKLRPVGVLRPVGGAGSQAPRTFP